MHSKRLTNNVYRENLNFWTRAINDGAAVCFSS